MDRDKYIFEKAMNRIDVKFIEEPLQRKEQMSTKEKTALKTNPSLLLIAAAMIICFIMGGVLFLKSNPLRPDESVEPTVIARTEATDVLTIEEQILLLVAEKKNVPVSDGQVHYSHNGYYAEDFAPFYGGTYVNAEGKRVVCLARSAGEKAVREAEELLQDKCDLYKEVKYSYSDLINVMSDLANYYHSEEYAAKTFQITKFEIDAAENVVQVSLTSLEKSDLDEICKHTRFPEAVKFSLTSEIRIPAEPNAPAYYGILQCERDSDIDAFVRSKVDEMLEGIIFDPTFYHAEDRDLNDLYILAPFKLWQETETGLREVEEFIQYPVASNGRVICTIIVIRASGELHYNVSDMYVIELNQACSDNRNRVVVFDEEAAEIGDHEKAIRLAFLSDDHEGEHDANNNVFLNVSGRYHQ